MQTQMHSCENCGMEFQVSCLLELQEKLKNHKCQRPNKNVERTLQLQKTQVDQFVQDVAADRIHQYKFNQLVKQGVFIAF